MGLNEKIFDYLKGITLQQLVESQNKCNPEVPAITIRNATAKSRSTAG